MIGIFIHKYGPQEYCKWHMNIGCFLRHTQQELGDYVTRMHFDIENLSLLQKIKKT